MPGMPEIIGESRATVLETAEEEPQAVQLVLPSSNARTEHTVDPLEGYISPSRLRLNDFSGGGERAPPEV